MDFGSENPVPLFDGQDYFKNFSLEMAESVVPFLVAEEVPLREIAATVILQNSKSADKVDALIPYLAMTYYDRFKSKNTIPNVLGRASDDIVLAATSCLTIAWKMRDKSFSFLEFLKNKNLNRDYQKHILKMELEILQGLEWRTRAVTPMSFVPYFLERCFMRGIRRKAVNQIIIESQDDIRFTRFKPSVIAAAAVIVASKLVVRDGNTEVRAQTRCKRNILRTRWVIEEHVDRCYDMMVAMCMEKNICVEAAEDISEDLKKKMPSNSIPSSQSHPRRKGKQPVREITKKEDEAEVEAEAEAGMNFELQWRLDPSELKDRLRIIDSPLAQSPAPAAFAEARDEPTTRHGKWGKRTCFKL